MNDGLDGMTIDLNDNLWAAVYGGGKVCLSDKSKMRNSSILSFMKHI